MLVRVSLETLPLSLFHISTPYLISPCAYTGVIFSPAAAVDLQVHCEELCVEEPELGEEK